MKEENIKLIKLINRVVEGDFFGDDEPELINAVSRHNFYVRKLERKVLKTNDKNDVPRCPKEMKSKIIRDIELELKYKKLGYKTLCFPQSTKGYHIKRPYIVIELEELDRILNQKNKHKNSTTCCVTNCKCEARWFISNNLFNYPEENIPFCNEHFTLYDNHNKAREKFFKEIGEINNG